MPTINVATSQNLTAVKQTGKMLERDWQDKPIGIKPKLGGK